MQFCTKCGKENQDTAEQCTSCGNSFKQTLNLELVQGSEGGALDGIKGYIDNLLRFFDSGDFFKISWKWLLYHIQAVAYALLPISLIVSAINMEVFSLPAKYIIATIVAFIFVSIASFLSVLAILNKTNSFDEITKDFSTSKVTLANFYDFFKVAFVHSIETSVYAFGIFASIAIFGLAVCSLFVKEIRDTFGWYVMLGFVSGPAYSYVNIFITKIIVLFLTVFLEYLPKLFIFPIRALYSLFGIIIDTRRNLWKNAK